MSYEKIEQAAVKLFSDKTYPAVGMRDISDAVGILAGSLYSHIANKEDLLLGIVRRGYQTYIEALTPISKSNRSAADRLRSIMGQYMQILHGIPELTRVSFDQWEFLDKENRQEIDELRRQYEEIFSVVVADGIAANEFPSIKRPRVAVLATMGLLDSAMRWYSNNDAYDACQVGDELADLVLQGLCTTSRIPA